VGFLIPIVEIASQKNLFRSTCTELECAFAITFINRYHRAIA
jgi:hypothetical protein